MQWSVDGQSPAFLAATRMMTLRPQTISTVLETLQLKPGMRVLDVGCGSGEYTFRLGAQTEGISFTGLDYDDDFIAFANKRARGELDYPFEAPNVSNSYSFIAGDGLNLPFENASFDAVVSHTYLTALPDWASALAEMCRVCKPGGTVSSITSMTDDFYGTGTIGLFSALSDPDDAALLERIDSLLKAYKQKMDLTSGIAPRKVPVAFDWIGLQNVACKPLAHYFCLSDANISEDEYERYVWLLHEMQVQEANRIRRIAVSDASVTEEDWFDYYELIDKRRDELLDKRGCNHEWNWYGASSLFVCGTVADESMNTAMESFKDAQKPAMKLKNQVEACGIDYSLISEQLGIGRCISVSLKDEEDNIISVCGFDPQQALEEAFALFLLDQAASVSTEALSSLLLSENKFKEAEDVIKHEAERNDFNALSDWYAYSFPQVWETVAEAAQTGISTSFAKVECESAGIAIACCVKRNNRTETGIAVHDNPQTATYRALARALGALIREA